MMDKKEGWHFLKGDKRLRYEPYTLIEPGTVVEAVGKIKLCQNGCHASERILDALAYVAYVTSDEKVWACRVLVEGEIACYTDKFVGRKRTCLWMVDATNILHEFGCRCAEDALSQVDSPDPRSVAVIKAKRAWLRGEISDEELYIARAAAWDVARDMAGDEARAVADAAWAVAYAAADAAYAAAYAAADAVAYAAYAAAYAVADAAAAAWNKYNGWLEEMVIDAHKSDVKEGE